MNSPYFSICVPTFNRQDLIGETIESILAQTFGDFELVVVDDGSTDNTRQVVEGYAARDPRVRYVRCERNRGVVPANNRCMAEAKGRYIYVFDSDDLMFPDNLRLRHEFFETHPDVAVLYSDGEIMDEQKRPLFPSYWAKEGYRPFRGRLRPEMLAVFGMFAMNGATCIRRDVYESLGPQPEEFTNAHDNYYFLRAVGRYETDYLPDVLVRIRNHGGTVSDNPGGEKLMQRAEALRRIAREYPSACPRWRAGFYEANFICRAGLAEAECRRFASARRYFGAALRAFPLHLPALVWYGNTFLNIRPLWNFERFKALYLALTGGGRKPKS